ncbi:MAG: carbohydrate ABC transporter permease [Oscillospiraceae bacterium]|jgi:ABC-type glycerol-3-phosphate transport system permease component|nr:carbohydrate ABC transporter permease [Oscillospiraceae bacterium]
MKRRLGFNFFDLFVLAFCVVFALICFYPIWYVLVVSITPYEQFLNTPFVLAPPLNPDFTYYTGIFTSNTFLRSMSVSVVVTLVGTSLCLLVTSSVAYAVSKTHIRGMKLLNAVAVFTMFFSGGTIPTFMLYKNLGLLENPLVMVIPGAFNVTYYIIMRNYFSYSVPKELEEAARIDRANDIQVFGRIVLPLSRPMLAAIGLFIAVGYWNDYYTYMVYCQIPKFQPFMWALRRMLTDATFTSSTSSAAQQQLNIPKIPALSLRMATVIVAIFPILIVYPFLQRHFAKGILIGAVKG